MKNMKRITGLVLVLILMLSLCACGAKTDKNLLATWRCDLDYTSIVTGESSEEMAPYLPENRLVLPMVITFKEDMTYVYSVDTEGAISSMEQYVEALTGGMVEMIYQQAEAEGIDRETMAAMFEEANGMDLRTYCRQQMEASVDMEAMFGNLGEEEISKWKAKDGKLFVDDDGTGFHDDSYILYTVENGTLTFSGSEGNAMGLDELSATFDGQAFYPLVWVKQP